MITLIDIKSNGESIFAKLKCYRTIKVFVIGKQLLLSAENARYMYFFNTNSLYSYIHIYGENVRNILLQTDVTKILLADIKNRYMDDDTKEEVSGTESHNRTLSLFCKALKMSIVPYSQCVVS